MSYIHKPALQPMEHRTLMQLFDIHANVHRDREAFVIYSPHQQRSSFTFQQMQQLSLSLAASFLQIGWKRGQKIALFIPNRIEFLVSYMALLRIGANVILLPSSGKKVEELIALLKLSKSQGIVACATSDDSFNTLLMEKLSEDYDSSQVVMIDEEHSGISYDRYIHYDDLLESGKKLNHIDVLKVQNQVQMEDPAVVMFTSGSTGQPKGVQHTNFALVNGTINAGAHGFGIKIESKGRENACRLYNDGLFYTSGCQTLGITFVFMMGCTLVTVPPMKSVTDCDISYIMSVLQNENCTHALLKPYMIVDIINHPKVSSYNLDALKATVTGGQPLHHSLFLKLRSVLPKCTFFKVYGQTEVMGIATQMLNLECKVTDDDEMDVLPGNEVKITSEANELLPSGHLGEICVRSPISFLGYLENEEASTKVISRTGWVHTGDLGLTNNRGKLTIRGRCSDMIKRATVKVFPAEVEKVLVKYSDVKDVLVVGVPDVRFYEELCACVIPKEGSVLESSCIPFEKWICQQWASNEQGLSLKPKYVLKMEKFPKTKTGKPDRKAIEIIAAQKFNLPTMKS